MTTFRVRFVTCLLLISTLIYGCKKEEIANLIPADHIVLQTGKPIVTSVGLTVFADTVFLGICPKNVSCILPDNLTASVRLVSGQESRSLRLFAGFGNWNGGLATNRGDSTSVRFGDQLYKVILKGEYIGENEYGRTGRALLQVAPL